MLDIVYVWISLGFWKFPWNWISLGHWDFPWNWIAFYQNSFVISSGLLYHLIRRDSRRLANEAFTSNPIVSSKQLLNVLKIPNWSLPFLIFWRHIVNANFSEIFKGRQIILEPCRNSKYPIRCLLWCHKTLPGVIWTQAYSEPL